MPQAQRKLVSLPDQLLAEIDDYRFASRHRSEAEAIRALIERGLRDFKAEAARAAA